MRMLVIKSCHDDLFDMNMRVILTRMGPATCDIIGGPDTVKRIPQTPRFKTLTFYRHKWLASFLDIYREAYRNRYDLLFYTHDNSLGEGGLIYDLFACTIPWQQVLIADKLEIKEYRSRLKILLRGLVQFGMFIFRFLWHMPNRFKSYVPGFSDELLKPDLPMHFSFTQEVPPLHKRTSNDETRNCFPVSSDQPISLVMSRDKFKQLHVGVMNVEKISKKVSTKQSIRLSCNIDGQPDWSIEQPINSFLDGWNDHVINVKSDSVDSKKSVVINCQLTDDRPAADAEVYVSFPAIIKPKTGKKIIVIILDGVNRDHLGIYNSKSNNTPRLDAFFSRGLKYTSAFSQEIWTRPTFASMVTSYYPSHHQVTGKTFFLHLPTNLPNIAETLQRAGFATAAYVSHGWANQLYGYARGFDRFVWRQTGRKPFYDAKDITYFALETLEQGRCQDQFIFLHYFDTHFPFFPRSPYIYEGKQGIDFRDAGRVYVSGKRRGHFTEQDRALVEHAASRKVREMDLLMEPLFSKINSKDFRENTSVILTADHGFGCLQDGAFLENGTFRLVSETITMPLLVLPTPDKWGGPSKIFDAPVEASIDLFPTVLDLAGVSGQTSPYAQSYLPTAAGNIKEKEFAVSECIYFNTYQITIRNREECFYMRCDKESAGTKVFYDINREEKWFDLRQDPHMRKNLMSDHPSMSEKFKAIRKKLKISEFATQPDVTVPTCISMETV